MGKIDMEEFRSLLEKRRGKIQDQQEERRRSTAPVELDQSRVGRLSRMDAIQQQAMAKAADQRNRQELARIESALRRLEVGQYGICLGCGEIIPEGRLRIDPAATVCVGCAGLNETG